MKRKIGEIFKYKDKWYQCVEGDSCGECSLFTTECGSGTKCGRGTKSDLADKVFGQCSKVRRTDNKSVIFKKLEKVMNLYKYGSEYVRYKVSSPCFMPKGVSAFFNPTTDTMDIEIKQNKKIWK